MGHSTPNWTDTEYENLEKTGFIENNKKAMTVLSFSE